jgi:hypothetical protein
MSLSRHYHGRRVHAIGRVLRVADSVSFLADGRILQRGTAMACVTASFATIDNVTQGSTPKTTKPGAQVHCFPADGQTIYSSVWRTAIILVGDPT